MVDRSGAQIGNTQAGVQGVIDQLVGSGVEAGLQVAAYLDGDLIVDAWAGVADAATGQTEQAATVMANGLRKVGIEAKLMGELWPTMVERMKKPETSPDLVVYWISTYYADPNNWIGEMFHSGQWGTFKASSFYKNVKVDELLDSALKTTDRKVREKAYQDAARIVLDEAAGVWIYNTKYFGPWAKTLEGIRFSPIANGQELRWVYYAK